VRIPAMFQQRLLEQLHEALEVAHAALEIRAHE
jgi:hypothetical protein